jgi:hypothetical protein
MSTPSLLIVSSLVPTFGFTKAMLKQNNDNDNTKNFKTDLNMERLGANFFNKPLVANFFCVRFLQSNANKKRTAITGMVNSM